ncbi:MAG: hypothetical protein R3263_04915 [Myxococcota bacterium]|nr:hypothetical protein [Myxococcota bacterium]
MLAIGMLLALAALFAVGIRRLALGYPARPGLRALARHEAALIGAAAEAVFPPGGAVEPSGEEAGIVPWTDRYLGELPAAPRRLMRLLFLLVEHATLVFPAPGPRGRRRFSALEVESRQAVLDGWRTSRLFPRRLVFTSLRAILTMGYFADPRVLRELDLAPRAIRTPVREADLLYPPVGRGPEAVRHRPGDVDWTGETRPLGPDAPVHPDFAPEAGR